MDWLSSLLNIQSSIQAIIIVALICGIGLWLGKIRLGGISLGIAFVFFFGIFVGSLHLEIDHEMLDYCETFGLVLFVYALGLHVGPNFFGSLRAEGTALNLWSLGVIFLGTLLAVVLSYLTPIPMSDMIGVLCGATTNTPALGAAQQALEHAGVGGGRAALATAVTYPLGVLGVILAMMFIRKFFVVNDGCIGFLYGSYDLVRIIYRFTAASFDNLHCLSSKTLNVTTRDTIYSIICLQQQDYTISCVFVNKD